MINLIEDINKYLLFLLVFSITFENWDAFNFGGTQSIAYFTSILYILSCIPLLKYNFSLGPLKEYLFPLVVFLIIGICSTALKTEYAPDIMDFLKTRLFQVIILMFFVINQLRSDNELVLKVLNVYVLSILVMYLLYISGIGVEFEKGRLAIFGENPNGIGMKAVIAFLLVFSQLIEKKFSSIKFLIGIIQLAAFFHLIILSVSRGAIVSVFLGIIIIVFFIKIKPLKKLLLGLVTASISAFLFNYIWYSNELLRMRLSRTIETGDIGRNKLWVVAMRIIEDNMWIGNGLHAELRVMWEYLGHPAGVHNTFLWVLMTTGIIGFIFFMLFIFSIGRNLIKSYRNTGTVVFLVIYVILLLNWAKSGGGINKLFFWMFYAFIIGSTFNDKKLTNSI